MKYVFINHFNENMAKLTTEEKVAIREKTAEWLDAHVQSGKCLQVFCDCAGTMLLSIWDITEEECFVFGLQAPLRDFVSITYYPVIDFDTAKQLFRQTYSLQK